jgi:hypothetical protein
MHRPFFGCNDGVHAVDLAKGERKLLGLPLFQVVSVTGLAVTEDGARLFVVTQRAIFTVDSRIGATSSLVAVSQSFGALRAGPVTSDATRSGQFSYVMGCVIDEATRSLLMAEYLTHQIVRLRGVDV